MGVMLVPENSPPSNFAYAAIAAKASYPSPIEGEEKPPAFSASRRSFGSL